MDKSAGAGNAEANSNNIIFAMKDTKLYIPAVTLSAKDIEKLSKLLKKGFERSCIGINIKQKLRIKTRRLNKEIFLN